MKIIDEKGRLFGKINVIDFLVLLFIFALLPMFYFGYKILTKKTEVVMEAELPKMEAEVLKREFIEIETNCQLIKLKPEVAKNISVGDKELDENGQAIGEIISLGEITPYTYEFNVGSGKKLIKEDPILKQIPATLKIMAEVRGNNLYCKDKQILENSAIDFKTDRYRVEAIVLPLSTELSTTASDKTSANMIEKIKDELFISRKKIANIENRIGTLEKDNKKIANIEKKLTTVENKKITDIENKIDTLENRIDILEDKVDTIFTSPKIKRLIKK